MENRLRQLWFWLNKKVLCQIFGHRIMNISPEIGYQKPYIAHIEFLPFESYLCKYCNQLCENKGIYSWLSRKQKVEQWKKELELEL